MANGARYSGPALAAGAISQAIGDLFEGMLAGQKGGLEMEQKIGEAGRQERDSALKAAAFPFDAALSRAQSMLTHAQATKTGAETERLYRMTPEEIMQLRAETRRADAQSGQLGAQTQALNLEHALNMQAIEDWDQVRARAHAEKRPITRDDTRALLRRHPILLAGAGKIPAADLLDINELEAYLKMLAAQAKDNTFEHLLKAREQGWKEAGDMVQQIYGGKDVRDPAAADVQNWLGTANRNRILVEAYGRNAQGHITAPGRAPESVANYVMSRLKVEHPDEDRTTLMAWTYEILARVGTGTTTWQAAFDDLKNMRGGQPAKPRPQNAPPQERSGTAPETPGAPAPGTGIGPAYRYNPATGQFTR